MSIRKRLDNITQIPEDCFTETPPAPKSLKIELSPNCNYRCRYCSITARRNSRTNMPREMFEAITRDATGVTEIGPFLIGEPFTSPDALIQSIHYLRHTLAVPYIFLTSNAALANPSDVRLCMEAGLNSLKWSCNFSDDDQFHLLTHSSPKWFHRSLLHIREAFNIRNLIGASTRLYASSILYDEEQKSRMAPLLESYILPYVDEHYWLPLYSMGGQAKDAEKKMGMTPIPGNSGRVDNPVPPIPCWTLFTAAHVLSDGRMTACCADGTGNWAVGDLTKMSFMEAWHSEEFKALRRAHLTGDVTGTKCAECAFIRRD